jgi:hypothetical protein
MSEKGQTRKSRFSFSAESKSVRMTRANRVPPVLPKQVSSPLEVTQFRSACAPITRLPIW